MEKAITRRGTKPVAVVVAGIVGAGTLLVGCGGSTSASVDTTQSTAPTDEATAGAAEPSASSTSGADAARSLATAAYLGMWRDMTHAAATSDWEAPTLAHHATGEALSAMSRGLYADHLNGLVTKGKPKDSPKVTSVDPASAPTTVMVSDCGDSSHWLKYRKSTGKLADHDPGGRQAITAEVKRGPDGRWKVTRFAVEGVGSC